MGGEGLVILIVAQRDALIIERLEGPIENLEGAGFLLFLRDRQATEKQEKKSDRI